MQNLLSKITAGSTADLHLHGNNSIDVHVFDICADGQHAIVGNIHHPKESFPVEINRLTASKGRSSSAHSIANQ